MLHLNKDSDNRCTQLKIYIIKKKIKKEIFHTQSTLIEMYLKKCFAYNFKCYCSHMEKLVE